MIDENALFGISPFASFWMAGFECTDKLNAFGNRVDFLSVTKHLEKIYEDYENLALFNIKTVREGIRWSKAEPSPYSYYWEEVRLMIDAAKQTGIQQVWDICHFGFPDDITPLHPMFARRFSALCRAFVKFYRSVSPSGELIVTPINEVSFLSWLGGDVRVTSPYCLHNGWEVKYSLMKAYIEGVEVMRAEDPSVKILSTEPLVNIVPSPGADATMIAAAAKENEIQYQAMDMLTGRMCPELRGRPEYLDISGCNYYYPNQWDLSTGQALPWANENNDPRFRPLNKLIEELYRRYNRPVVLSETSHPLEDRPQWLTSITDECSIALQAGVPLWGICWYPIIDRPDWDHMQPWHRSGIWDIDNLDGKCTRTLHEPTAAALRKAQERIGSEQQRAKMKEQR